MNNRGPSTPRDKFRAVRASLRAVERKLIENRHRLEAIDDWRRARMIETALKHLRNALSE